MRGSSRPSAFFVFISLSALAVASLGLLLSYTTARAVRQASTPPAQEQPSTSESPELPDDLPAQPTVSLPDPSPTPESEDGESVSAPATPRVLYTVRLLESGDALGIFDADEALVQSRPVAPYCLHPDDREDLLHGIRTDSLAAAGTLLSDFCD